MVLKFILSEQSLVVHPSQERQKVVADSKNYLVAQFDCRTAEWKNGPIWILFAYNGRTYKKLLGSDAELAWNECYVPAEVIHSPKFTVSAYTGDRVTTNSVIKKIEESGYTEDIVNERRTPTTTEQIDMLMKRYAMVCNSILQDCAKIKEEIERGE